MITKQKISTLIKKYKTMIKDLDYCHNKAIEEENVNSASTFTFAKYKVTKFVEDLESLIKVNNQK